MKVWKLFATLGLIAGLAYSYFFAYMKGVRDTTETFLAYQVDSTLISENAMMALMAVNKGEISQKSGEELIFLLDEALANFVYFNRKRFASVQGEKVCQYARQTKIAQALNSNYFIGDDETGEFMRRGIRGFVKLCRIDPPG